MKNHSKCRQKKKNTLSSYLLIFFGLLLFAILLAHSPLLTGHLAEIHIDSQVYIHAAQQILQGRVLYLDLFDHKGPFWYLIECGGLLFSPQNLKVLWMFQLAFLLATITPLFLYWKNKFNPFIAIAAMLIFIAWLIRTLTIGDNIPELYASGLVSLMLFLFFQIVNENKSSTRYIMLYGVCSMALFLMKANFVILIIPVSVSLLFHSLRVQKNFKVLIYLFSGYLIGILPFIIYFLYHHALSEAFYAFWTFNFEYIDNQKLSIFDSIQEVFLQYKNSVLQFILIAIVAKLLWEPRHRSALLIPLITFLLAAVVLVGLPGRGRDSLHYIMPMAPVIAWIAVIAFEHRNKMEFIIVILIGIYFCKPLVMDFYSGGKNSGADLSFVPFLKQHKIPGETLAILGNYSSIYAQTGMPCNTSYFYTYPIVKNCNSELPQKFLLAFRNNPANWLLYQKQFAFDTCITNLKNDYQLGFENEEWIVFRRSSQ